MSTNHTIKATICGVMSITILLPIWGQTTQNDLFEGFHHFAAEFNVNENPSNNPQYQTNTTGISLLKHRVLRQTGNRTFAYPTKRHKLITNPPTFTWPKAEEIATSAKAHKAIPVDNYLRYDIQIGRTPDFNDQNTFLCEGLPMAFYNHHKAFAPGIWYWRHRVSGGEWSQTYEMNIPESVQKFESPITTEAYQMIPEQHPRIYKCMNSDQKKNDDQKALLNYYINSANVALKKSPEHYKVKGKAIPANASDLERAKIFKFRLRYELESMNDDIANLLNAYLLTNEKQYVEKAISFTDHIAGYDPIELYNRADFTGSKSMSTIAMTYDLLYDYLNKAKRQKYEHFISATINCVMEQVMAKNIGATGGLPDAHFFQHSFFDVFTSTIIMKDHLKNVEKWFGMLYNIWLSRSPGGGFLDDGVWPNGNIGYFHVNLESMVSNYVIYRELFGVNIFNHPWYKNCANAMAYTWPIGSAGDGFGDSSENITPPNQIRAGFAYILGQELNNPFALNYAYIISGQNPDKTFIHSKATYSFYRSRYRPKHIDQTIKYEVPQSAVFPNTGIVTMNTDVLNPDKNLFVSFMSSPFGVSSHGIAEQNSFNISYKGKPIFYPTGYRITTQDKSYLLSQKHSRARNTITVDGMTQAFSCQGYGWIARYLDGKDITYTLGDASKAYVPFKESTTDILKKINAYTRQNGFITSKEDNPQVRLFRRHLTLLRPNILVVYDELAANKEVIWTFQLNGRQRSNMFISEKNEMLIADTDNADAAAKIIGSSPVTVNLVDTNFVKPYDWLNPQRGRKAKTFETNQYHGKVENIKKCNKMRFLAIIQIDESDQLTFIDIVPDEKGNYNVGNYRINAQMDIKRDARLEIENTVTGEYLLYGPTEGEEKVCKRKYSHSTLLINPQAEGTNKFKESIDCHPLMVP